MRKKHSHMPEILLTLLGVILIGTALYHILPDYLDNKKSADTYQTLEEKYLRSDIYGEEHIAGSLFLEGKSKPDFSDYYTIIYGHNMRDGSMFGELDLYKETDFWKNHQYFTLYTENMAYRYHIFSSQMASMSGKVFRIGYILGKEYEDFIGEMVQDSLIETGLHSESSDRILTLSTCTGNGYDSRMTVHAVCIDEQTTDPERLL